MLSVIPMLLIVVITYINTSKSYQQNSSTVIELLLSNQATVLNMKLKDQGAVFNGWTKEDVYGMSIEFETIEEIQSSFGTMLDRAPAFGLLILSDKEGKILGSVTSKSLAENRSLDLKGQRVKDFNGFSADKRIVRIAENHYLTALGQPFTKTFELVFPTKNSSGEHNGYLIAVLDWSYFHNQIETFITQFIPLGYENAYAVVAEIGQPNSISHSKKELIGKPFNLTSELEQWIRGTNERKTALFEIGGINSFLSYQRIVDNDTILMDNLDTSNSAFYLGIIVPEDDVLAFVQSLLFISIIISLIGMAVILIVSFFIGRQISKPMVKAVDLMNQFGEGQFDSRADKVGSDEIAQMSEAMNDFADVLQLSITNINGVLAALANGDLHQSADVELKGELDVLKKGVNHTVDIISQMIEEVAASSDKIDTSSSELALSSQNLADGTSKQAASLQEISSTVNEINSQGKTNNENAEIAQQITKQTLDIVKTGNEKMQDLLRSMQSIEETSSNVSKINKVIDEIAFQTNLLALNAAVEAARAGKYGKGFAVVAEEVRNLASRSADAAKNTTELIEASVKEINSGVQSANETASVLTEVNEGVEKITDLVSGIAAASAEQAVAVDEINKGLTQVNEIVQQNSAISEQTAASSNVLSSQVEDLKNMLGRFSRGKGQQDAQKRDTIIKSEDPDRSRLPGSKPSLALPASHSKFTQHPAPKQIMLDDDEFGKY